MGSRLQRLDQISTKLDDIQTELEDLETTNDGKRINEEFREAFEPRLFRIKANLQARLPAPVIPEVNQLLDIPPTRANSTLAGLRLPTISLPDFDGDYKIWLTFHDTFLALIHNNAELPAIQKFHYLRSAVKGEAAQLIEAIAISALNYPIAWNTLINRYSNEYLSKKRHLQALLEIPRMKKETAASLHSTLDEFQRHIKILEQLGEPTSRWSTILEHLLCVRLHDDTLKAWEDHAAAVEDQSYMCLVEFLEKRVRVLESISVNQVSSPSNNTTVNNGSFVRKFHPIKISSHATTENAAPQCCACNQRHLLVKCPKFERMSVNDRLRVWSIPNDYA